MEQPVNNPPKEESIFEVSNLDLKRYQRHVSNARNALFILAAVKVLFGVLMSFISSGEDLIDIWIEVLIVAGTFLVLAMIAEKSPYNALVAALVIYLLYIAIYFVLEPSTLFRGIIVKILVISYLTKGIINAGEIKNIKKITGS